MSYTVNNVIVSPCSNPEMELEPALEAYSALGYRKFEAFTSWCKSALDYSQDPRVYQDLAKRFGMRFASMHLPAINDNLEESLQKAIQAAKFASALGICVVLYKANSRENYIRGAKAFLDATAELTTVPVLQNHAGSPITTLDDFKEVIDGIADSRMKTLLEVGHFHSVGVSWKEGYDLLGESIRLVHIKDQAGSQSMPFGEGEIDLPGLFRFLGDAGYQGDFVVEMEVKDTENTLRYLGDALAYLKANCLEATHE